MQNIMTIPTRPAPPPPQSNQQQHQNGGVNIHSQNYSKLSITLPPPPSAKHKVRNSNVGRNSTNQIYASTSSVSIQENNNSNRSITRHFPQARTRYESTTSSTGNSFDLQSDNNFTGTKKAPPPRPPPPKISISPNDNKFSSNSGIIKSSRPPQSINVLSNLFGRRKSPATVNNGQKIPAPKIPQLMNSQILTYNHNHSIGSSNNLFSEWSSHQNQQIFSINSNTSPHNFDSNDVQLISFDSPPNSPTFTQKSNSDCVSVDSFSSDSNFSSPHNGSVSQPESGFEDDFSTANASTSSTQLTTPVDPWDVLSETKSIKYSGQLNYAHLNNMKNIDGHPIRNLHILQRKNNENIGSNTINVKTLTSSQQKLGIPTIIRPKMQKGLAPKPPLQIENGAHIFLSQSNYDIQSDFQDNDPPMPTCPPPPPPSILQNTNHELENNGATFRDNYDNFKLDDSNQSPYGIAMYNFDGVEDGDLSLRENDKIYLLSRLNEEWIMGRNKKGCEGIFPCSYIDIKVPLSEEDGATSQTYNAEIIKNDVTKRNSGISFNNIVKVLYTFESSHPEDLTLLENEMVKVLYRINEDWLYGEINNRQGQFPANFIERIPDNLVLKMP